MNYKKIYDALILKAKLQNRQKGKETYYEAHHIIPKCLGGKGECRQVTHPNIVLLTTKEHFIAHLLLVKSYPENISLKRALWSLLRNTSKCMKERYKPSSRMYEIIRNDYIKTSSGSGNPFYNKKHSLETKEKIRQSRHGLKTMLGKKHSEESKLKMSKAKLGKTLSKDVKEKIRLSRAGGNHPNAQTIICLKTGKIFGYTQELADYIKKPSSTVQKWLKGSTKSYPEWFHYKRQNLAYDQ